MFTEEQFKPAMTPKITSQLFFIDFDNPIVFAYLPAIILSILMKMTLKGGYILNLL